MRKPTKQRERTFNILNFLDYDENKISGFFEMPSIAGTEIIPKKLVGFNYVKTTKETECAIHFFLDDYQFERIWNTPHQIIPRLEKFQASLTPDFSLYADMPISMQIWNTYRNRLIGQMMEKYGINVIPTVSWSDKRSYNFCFDGLENCTSVTVSTVGVVGDIYAEKLWRNGMEKCLEKIKPKQILLYGNLIDFDFGNVEIYQYKQFMQERMK